MSRRKPYHRPASWHASEASGARTPADAVRRLGLRCGLLQPGHRWRATSAPGDGQWVLHNRTTGQRWLVCMLTQDYAEAAAAS